ncbi:MAG: hypothetical protein II325_08230 [Clostridia bacterium]|nr:hypothetical protein [Clostridia bacterium]
MAIVQDAFFIPDDIATGLATGIYRRIGSVVRYAVGPNKGQIVKHLKPIDLKAAEQAQGLGAKALQFVQQHKKGVTITVVCAAAIGAGWWGYTQWKNHEPKVLTDFRVALKKYVDAIRNGNMDIGKINALVIALEALKQHKHYDKISIQLTAEDLEVLVGRIYEYTVKLAEDNHVELDDTEKCLNKGVIIDLESYLKTQQRIIKVAA